MRDIKEKAPTRGASKGAGRGGRNGPVKFIQRAADALVPWPIAFFSRDERVSFANRDRGTGAGDLVEETWWSRTGIEPTDLLINQALSR